MQQVGYKLIEIASGDVIDSWGGNWGSCPAQPNPITLPNGDIVYSAVVGEDFNGYRLDAWMMEPPPPLPRLIG